MNLAIESPFEMLDTAREIYDRDGQEAVERWAEQPEIAPGINYRNCLPCEWTTPHVGVVCAVCWTANLPTTEREA